MGCARRASRAVRRTAARWRSSTTPPVRKPSGTGSSCPTHPRAGRLGQDRVPARRRAVPLEPVAWGAGPSMEQPQLIDAQHQVTRALGGLTRVWRFDRMATVVHPDTGRSPPPTPRSPSTTASVVNLPTPARQPQGCRREGQPHRRATMVAHPARRHHPPRPPRPGSTTFCATRGDARNRVDRRREPFTVATVAAAERLARSRRPRSRPRLSVQRVVSAQALVAFRGNRYSVPPELAGAPVTVTHRLGSPHLDIVTAAARPGRSPVLVVVALHHRAPDGTGATIRSDAHVTALNRSRSPRSPPQAPHRRKERIPPGPPPVRRRRPAPSRRHRHGDRHRARRSSST